MIRYIVHSEIDKLLWDSCIEKSANSILYGYSWYLDIVSPGWDALILDDYHAVFPLTHHRKMGIAYLRQPYFTQQLGIFSPEPVTQTLVNEFLWAIPERFRYIEIHLNWMNKVDPALFQCSLRVNHELSLVPAARDLQSAFSQNTRRNLRKAEESSLNTSDEGDPKELINLFKNNFGSRENKLKQADYQTIHDLMQTCLSRGIGRVWQSGRINHPADAMAFFVTDKSRYIMLFTATNYQTRDNGAMFLLLDRFISAHAEQNMVLDFEGGNDPGLGRFYKGFGSAVTTYCLLRINRLSHTMGSMISTIKRIRNR